MGIILQRDIGFFLTIFTLSGAFLTYDPIMVKILQYTKNLIFHDGLLIFIIVYFMKTVVKPHIFVKSHKATQHLALSVKFSE